MNRENPVRRRHLPQVYIGSPKPEIAPERAPEAPERDLVHWRRGEQAWMKIKPRVVPALVLALSLIVQPKRTIIIMLDWIKERGQEPSTYKGLTALFGVIGYQLEPQAFEIIVAVVLAVIGAIDFFQNEGKVLTKKEDPAQPE